MGINKLRSSLGRCLQAINFYSYCLRSPETVVYVDMSNLLYTYAYATIERYTKCDYETALRHIIRVLDKMKVLKLNVMLVFDGGDNDDKAPCYARRRRKRAVAAMEVEKTSNEESTSLKLLQDQLSIHSTYMGSAVQLCRLRELPYVVAYKEADAQMARTPHEAAGAICISKDTDMLALGFRKWITVDNGGWLSGSATLFDMDMITPSPAGAIMDFHTIVEA
jgi:5'-3' exonuclease